ncbi:bifunctional 4-hydroxy-3-methylbut-2-enyl diphosphate reductase/30S ribosomal protein S1 [Acetivibrio cellulolyticus]|uniref:bifunctional 4-hydroxy-3-methylbut-2-enyl diphosphate reductase/30S ribosomal protein S1 n=1 Tax=Acetivibrio cellulolyticus TaxID=35830 RepID=UPI0001E2BE3A|nr:bifunctional 4-hydroxy-3-methylbut-2-enyl diphosphate reductase/30S ribosomal protein S1 [Acetivibrio cellulolyticus]
MEIIVANSAGFCFGVNNAVKLVNELLETEKSGLYTYGPIIHNDQVVEQLSAKGVEKVENLDDVIAGRHIVIRAHGVAPDIYDIIKSKGLILNDATCPYVKKIHNLVSEKRNEGYEVIIVGDKDHPEIIGINGWCGNKASVVNSIEDVDKLDMKSGKICVVAQTTLSKQKWEKIIEYIENKFGNIIKFDTICSATSKRQDEACDISRQVDMMIIIGGSHSSNTQKLYEICLKNCPKTYKVETSGELPPVDIKKIKKIGISAGASTPDWVIEEVIKKMSDLNNQKVEMNEKESEMNFADAFEKSMVTLRDGDVVTGKVIGFNSNEIFVDLGYKSDGIIPIEEYTDEPDFKIESEIKVGDKIEVYVKRVNDGEGNVLLSKKHLDSLKSWDEIIKAYEDKTPIRAIVVDVVNGGVIASAKGVRIFVPASQISDKFVKELNEFLKKPINVRIIEYNDKKRKLVGSARVLLEEEKAKKSKAFWDEVEVGKIYSGVVKSLTDFGVFVDIGGVDGLIHISELSWSRIKHPSEVVKVGDKVQVSILEFKKEKGKISLGYRKTEDNPWVKASEKYKVGDVVNVKVLRFAPFGTFVELEEGIDGLVHISQISSKRLAKPEDVLTAGMKVDAKILEFDLENKKISLSIKEVKPIDPVVEEKENSSVADASSASVEDQSEHKEEMNVTLGDMFEKGKE